MDIFNRIVGDYDVDLQEKILDAFMQSDYETMRKLIRLYGLDKLRDEFNVALGNLTRLKGFMDSMVEDDQQEYLDNEWGDSQ